MFSKASDHEKFSSYFVKSHFHNDVLKKPCYYGIPSFHPRVSRNGPMSGNGLLFLNFPYFVKASKSFYLPGVYPTPKKAFNRIFLVFIYP